MTLRMTRRIGAIGLATAVITGLTATSASAADDKTGGSFTPGLTAVNLLDINDFHGHFSNEFACTLITQEAALGADKTAFVSAGDNVGGTPFVSASQNDEPAISFLNALGLSASAVGNHEFDKGFNDLTGRIMNHADWPYSGANVYWKGTMTPALPEYSILTVNGVKVALIGAVTQETAAKVSPDGIKDIEFGDPVDAVNRVAAKLKSSGMADIIVGAYHEGADASESDENDLAALEARSAIFKHMVQDTSADVDVILNGDKHEEYTFAAPIPGGTGTRPVIQSKQYGERLGVLQLRVDPSTKQLVEYSMDNLDTSGEVTAECEADARYAKAAAIVAEAEAKAAEIGQSVIGAQTNDITTAVKVDGERDDRQRESTLSNMIAQSYVDSMNAPGRSGAQIGVMNPGGVRSELYYEPSGSEKAGEITFQEAADIMPFNNMVMTKDLTGAQVKVLLEQQWQPADASRPFLKLGVSNNVSYTYDPSAAEGSRVLSVLIDGMPLKADSVYTVASNSFLMAGGDNFTVLAEGTNKKDSGLVDQSLFVDWIKANSPLSPSFVKHAVAITDQPTELAAGETVSFSAAGFDLTSVDSPSNTSVEVFVDGVSMGSYPITSGLIDTTVPTLNGTASISFTVPDSVEDGTALMTLVASPTMTTVGFPVTLKGAEGPIIDTDLVGSDVNSLDASLLTLALALGLGSALGVRRVRAAR